MKGLDWPALVKKYRDMVACARTDNEFEWCMARLMGELNASHTGVSVRGPEDDSTRRPAGRLGIRTRPVEGGFEILATLPEGPAVRSQTPLKVGDVITGIAGQPLQPTDALEARMRGRVGEETLITVRRVDAEGQPKLVDCLITPCAGMEEADLNYKAATTKAARLVNEWSGGRLGYSNHPTRPKVRDDGTFTWRVRSTSAVRVFVHVLVDGVRVRSNAVFVRAAG